MRRATKFERIIFYPGGQKIVDIGKNGRQTCTLVPDTLAQARSLIKTWPLRPGFSHSRGPGDDFILNNDCEVKYYENGKLIAHLK